MDLSTIQMHLDNFVNTWEGWYKVANAITGAGNDAAGVFNVVANGFFRVADAVSSYDPKFLNNTFDALSS